MKQSKQAVGLVTESWLEQRARWPTTGKHILAQYSSDGIVVYQAYRPEIADWAVEHQSFGGPWSFERMSWIKTNFLWMMYRSGWASKSDQERVLAVTLKRSAFDQILERARNARAPANHTTASWREVLRSGEVRLQWDPDHEPDGSKCDRRAVQLGLRGATLRSYANDWVIGIEDISDWVHQQREVLDSGQVEDLVTPREEVYIPQRDLAVNVGLELPSLGEPLVAVKRIV